MNFNKLPKEKRMHFFLALLGTGVVLAGIGFGLINNQYASLRQIDSNRVSAESDLQKIKDMVRNADQIETELSGRATKLADQEEGMASGDLYSWLITKLRTFKLSYHVDIPQFSPIVGPSDVNLIPKFPYQQATMTVFGTGYYHDFGKFISDFENEYPHIRVVNLSLEPATAAGTGDREKLMFKMDVIALVKPTHP